MREDRVGEKVGRDFDKLGLGKGGAEIVVGEVNRPEEGVTRHDRVEEEVDTGERSDVSGGGAGRLEAVTPGGTANATVHAGGEATERTGEKEGGDRPLLFGDGVQVGGGGGGEVDGTEGASGLDQLHQFGVAGEKPLKTVGARQCRAKGKGRA